MTKLLCYSILFIVILRNYGVLCSLQCLDENGEPVDWFVVYKLPKISHESSMIKNGRSYFYITSKTLVNGWVQSDQPISIQDTLVAKTLAPFYSKNNDGIWLTYNDDWYHIFYGHAKGVVGANKDGGFWLIHSVPFFPSQHGKYSYPFTGYTNGQSMLCITLPQDQIDLIGKILMYYKPHILKKKINASIQTLYPNLVSAAKGAKISKAPWEILTNIYSVGGRNFTHFAKAKKFNKDLYTWVAAELKTNIYAETWMHGMHLLPSTCDTYQVLNIQSIKFRNKLNSTITFSSYHDHSKWAISDTAFKPWVCIGDINRAVSQEKRGGGTMCLEDKMLWEAYHSIVGDISNCKTQKH